MASTPTPAAATVGAALTKLVDSGLAVLFDSRRFSKLVSWGMVALAGVFHSELGVTLTSIIASTGGLSSIVHAIADTNNPNAPSKPSTPAG